jgi:hypothetical protein
VLEITRQSADRFEPGRRQHVNYLLVRRQPASQSSAASQLAALWRRGARAALVSGVFGPLLRVVVSVLVTVGGGVTGGVIIIFDRTQSTAPLIDGAQASKAWAQLTSSLDGLNKQPQIKRRDSQTGSWHC